MRKLSNFQMKLIRNVDWRNCAPIANLIEISKAFGIAASTFKDEGFYVDPETNILGKLGGERGFTIFLSRMMGENPIQELRYTYSRRKRERMQSALDHLQKICPDMWSEYDRHGRIVWAQVKDVMKIAGIEITSEFEEACRYRYQAIYDDTCGIGGGHHSYVTWSTKGFIPFRAIQKEMNKKEWVEI